MIRSPLKVDQTSKWQLRLRQGGLNRPSPEKALGFWKMSQQGNSVESAQGSTAVVSEIGNPKVVGGLSVSEKLPLTMDVVPYWDLFWTRDRTRCLHHFGVV